MNKTKETRLIRIDRRIITVSDLLKLANVIFKEYKILKKSDKYAFVSFSVTCDDDSVFDSESPEIFSDSSPYSSKRVISVSLHLGTILHSRHIYVKFNHATSSYSNSSYIEVKGSDSKWVNGILRIIEEMVDGFTPQNNFAEKYRYLLQTIISIGVGIIMLNSLSLLMKTANLPQTTSTPEGLSGLIIALATKYTIAQMFFIYLFYWLLGYIPAGYLVDKLRGLWPSIEIQVGAEHKFIENHRRGWLINIFLLGILPLLLQVAYDIVKFFITAK